jgi:hypothetical protein
MKSELYAQQRVCWLQGKQDGNSGGIIHRVLSRRYSNGTLQSRFRRKLFENVG